MSNETVRRKLLVLSGELNIPLNCRLSRKKVNSACEAAKIIRYRLLREHTRVTQNIEGICREQWHDDDEVYEALSSGMKGTSRDEFLFIAELMILEKMVLPLLLAHGLNHSESLLPQFLKLITAMLLPIPRFSQKETVQKDALAKLKQRCSTDEIMSFLIQVVAPIAGKRKAGNIEREDVVLLEVVLNLLSLLLHGSNENIIGSFSRNHGIEMLLVVINQNFAKKVNEKLSSEKSILSTASKGTAPSQKEAGASCTNISVPDTKEENNGIEPTSGGNDRLEAAESFMDEPVDVDLAGSESDNDLVPINLPEDVEEKLAAEMQEKALDLILENDNRLWKWNKLIISCISCVVAASPGEELAQWCLLLQQSNGSTDKISVQRNSQTLQACIKERTRWRNIARSRSGPMASNSIFVRRDAKNNASMYAVGTVSTLLGGGTHRKDSLEAIRMMDSRKRGRFIKGMFQDTKPKCSLPIETQLELSKQVLSFFLYGFEPLTVMVWDKLRQCEKELGEALREYTESRAGYKHSEEEVYTSSPLNLKLYNSLHTLLDSMSIGGTFLRFMREFVCYHSKALGAAESGNNSNNSGPAWSFPSPLVHQLWQRLSVIISLDRFAHVFAVLQLFLASKDVRRRTDIRIPISFATELLLVLQLLMEGKLRQDPVVQSATHALASTVLYHHEVVKTLFDLIGCMSNYIMPLPQARALTLFAYAVFQLVEACSFGGKFFVPNLRERAKKSDRSVMQTREMSEGIMKEEEEEKGASQSSEAKKEDRELLEMLEASGVKGSRGNETERKEANGKRAENSSSLSSSTRISSPLASEKGPQDKESKEMEISQRVCSPNTEGNENGAMGSEDDNLSLEEESKSFTENVTELEHVKEETQQEEKPEDEGENRDDDTASEAPSSFSHFSNSSNLTSSSSLMESDKELTLSQLLQRLGSPKNIYPLLVTLRHWRTNDADVNLALVYLMEAMMKEGEGECVFFSLPFLLPIREVLSNGQATHGPLYKICDELIFRFFNPTSAHIQDERFEITPHYQQEGGGTLAKKPSSSLTGAQSFLGFEVALRCARSLFFLSPLDYSLLEEKAMSYLQDNTSLPLPGEEQEDEGETSIMPKVDLTTDHHLDFTLADDHRFIAQDDEQRGMPSCGTTPPLSPLPLPASPNTLVSSLPGVPSLFFSSAAFHRDVALRALVEKKKEEGERGADQETSAGPPAAHASLVGAGKREEEEMGGKGLGEAHFSSVPPGGWPPPFTGAAASHLLPMHSTSDAELDGSRPRKLAKMDDTSPIT